MFRKILSTILLSIFAVIVIMDCFNIGESSSAIRISSPKNIIILEENVPLADNFSNDICIDIFNQLNTYRVSSGLIALKWNNELEAAAVIRADEAGILWSHTRPDGSSYYSVNPDIVYGENLAKGYSTAQEVINAWKASPSHNENLLYPDFKYVGISKIGNCYACEFSY